MKRLAATLALLATTASAQSITPPTDTATQEAIRLIDAWADAGQVYGRWPAYSVAIGHHGRLLWSKGYGTVDAAKIVPAKGDTIYSICSISKLFTAVAVMQQWEAGKLRLDEPVTTYLPWAAPKPDGRDSIPVTLRALLTHSAGVQRDSDVGNWTGPNYLFPTRDHLQAEISQHEPLYPVGRTYQYSNIGVTLAGEAAVAVSGRDYNSLVTSGIIAPLGLNDTRPDHPYQLLGTRMAVGWSPLDRAGNRTLLSRFDAKAITPAAGFTSTAEDLVRFGLWQIGLLAQETAPAKPDVLKPSTLREMHRIQFIDKVNYGSWGLGFFNEDADEGHYIGHDGSCPGYHTAMLIRPDSETAVAVMTTDNHETWDDTTTVHKLLDARRAHAWKGPAPVTARLEDYAGRYTNNTWNNETIILPWNGGLVTLDLPDPKAAEHLSYLKPIAQDRFRRIAKDGSEMHEVTFKRDASGRVVAKEEYYNRSVREVK
ncbi:serine hydrolase domain-containing protein [Sandarakinorhabdus sp. AAP62]|uniref:serine hydrolase domain-containing protein n=1 Tax=Sandarakinorhabdus sp. AAP62 TaxID=1248916 RepID=UPI00030B9A20|nr:serine hydrolase domain-containing protein [Sandarakinorhabdus sp. AAP62]